MRGMTKPAAPVALGGAPLTLADLRAIAEGGAVALDPGVPARIAPARALIERVLSRGETVYGVNTGFGELKSVDSIPTSAGQEDHVSMGMHAALKALALVRNVRRIVAGELLCAAQGIHTLRLLRSSRRLEAALESLRTLVPPLTGDRRPDRDLERLDEWIRSGAGSGAAEVPWL